MKISVNRMQTIRVRVLDVAEISLVFAATLTLLLCAFCAPASRAQKNTSKGKIAALQTFEARNVTLHILRAGFYSEDKLYPYSMTMPKVKKFGARKSFAIYYRLQSPTFSTNELMNMKVTARMVTPWGEMMEASGGSNIIQWRGVDPSWGARPVEFSFELPRTSQKDKGKFTTSLVLDNLPLPQKVDQEIAINRTLVTPAGTRIHFSSVKKTIFKLPEDAFETHIELQTKWEIPLSTTHVNLQFGKVLDSNGRYLVAVRGGSSVSGRDVWLRTSDVSGGHADFATATIEVEEEFADWKKDDLEVRFPFFDIQLQDHLPLSPVVAQVNPLLHLSSTRSAQGRLEDWNLDTMSSVRSWLWLRGEMPPGAQPAYFRWNVKNFAARDQNGRKRDNVYWSNNERPHYLSNGTRAQDGENAFAVGFDVGQEGENRATSLDLDVEVEPQHYVRHFWMADIAIPALGQETTPMQEIKALDGTILRIERVRHFQSPSDLPAWKDGNTNLPPRGVAVVVRWLPTFNGTISRTMRCTGAFDPTGIDYKSHSFGNLSWTDATGTTSNLGGVVNTFVLQSPPQRVQNLKFSFLADEQQSLDTPQKMTFRNIAVPKNSLW